MLAGMGVKDAGQIAVQRGFTLRPIHEITFWVLESRKGGWTENHSLAVQEMNKEGPTDSTCYMCMRRMKNPGQRTCNKTANYRHSCISAAMLLHFYETCQPLCHGVTPKTNLLYQSHQSVPVDSWKNQTVEGAGSFPPGSPPLLSHTFPLLRVKPVKRPSVILAF